MGGGGGKYDERGTVLVHEVVWGGIVIGLASLVWRGHEARRFRLLQLFNAPS